MTRISGKKLPTGYIYPIRARRLKAEAAKAHDSVAIYLQGTGIAPDTATRHFSITVARCYHRKVTEPLFSIQLIGYSQALLPAGDLARLEEATSLCLCNWIKIRAGRSELAPLENNWLYCQWGRTWDSAVWQATSFVTGA